MRKATLLAVILLTLVGGASARPVAAAPTASPLFPPQTFLNVAIPASHFDLVQMIIDYDAGAASQNSAQSARFFTVMEGELSITIDSKTEVYAAGKSASAAPGVMTTLVNSGSKKARVFLSAIVAAWDRDPQLAAVSSAPASKTIYSVRQSFTAAPPVVNVIQAGARFDAGYETPRHIMNNLHGVLHLQGTTTYAYLDGGLETYTAGQGAEMYVGRPGSMSNRTAAPVENVWTWLQEPGRPLSLPVASPAAVGAPSTGDAGLAATSDAASPSWGLAAAVGAAAGAALLALDSRRRRANTRQ